MPQGRKPCEKCTKNANYGYKSWAPTRCKQHAEADMFYALVKRCDSCNRIAYYSYNRGALKCPDHKEEGMTHVKNMHCKECNSQPSYGYELNKPTHCTKHKKEDMLDVVHIRCDLCDKRASFGKDSNKPNRCKEHKDEYMKDVVHNRCEKCSSRPSYGTEVGKPIRCKTHKRRDMVDVVSKRCEICNRQPSFGHEYQQPLRCKIHRAKGMKNVRKPRCKTCISDVGPNDALIISERFQTHKLCYYHGAEKLGLSPMQRRQYRVFAFLEEMYDEEDLVFDCTDPEDDGRCSKKRPDVRIATKHRKLIIEVDENQHRAEQYSCTAKEISEKVFTTTTKERARMSEIATTGIVQNTIFIRFNPDTYRDEQNKIKKISMDDRLVVLKKEMDRWLDIDEKQEHICEVIYLFYNGKPRQTDFIPLDPEELKPNKKRTKKQTEIQPTKKPKTLSKMDLEEMYRYDKQLEIVLDV